MEISSLRGLPELGMEDTIFMNQWQMNSSEDFSLLPIAAAAFGENLQHSYNFPTFNIKNSLENSHMGINRPTKQIKTNTWNSSQTAFNPNSLSGVNMDQMGILKPKEEAVCSKSTSDMFASQGSFENQNFVFKTSQGAKRISSGDKISHTQDHILAERKRREKLSQKFIALSAIIPGLKKMDKASILGDAIKYLKQLQEKVKTLEEQTKKKTMESVVFVKKSQLLADGENSSSEENSSKGPFNEPLPEIEARICDKSVLIRVHCEKKKGLFEKTVTEIEKLHLTVINSSVLTFGNSALDVTIIAQMDAEFNMTVKDLVKSLHSAFQSFM